PAWLIADWSGRPQIVSKAERPRTFAKGCHFQRVFRTAHAGAGDRLDADALGAFLDRAGFQACDFGLGSPRFALGLEKPPAAARQRNKDEGADEIQTNSTRHAR